MLRSRGVQSGITRLEQLKGKKLGIPVICSATAPTPGVWTKVGCDVNIFQDYGELGTALADWVIVHSNGKMQGVILSDKTYSIVTAKARSIIACA